MRRNPTLGSCEVYNERKQSPRVALMTSSPPPSSPPRYRHTRVFQIPASFMMNPPAPPPPTFRVNNTTDNAGLTRGHWSVLLYSSELFISKLLVYFYKTDTSKCHYTLLSGSRPSEVVGNRWKAECQYSSGNSEYHCDRFT